VTLRHSIALLLQVLGLATFPLGLYVGIATGNVKAELIYCGIGAAIFYAGRLLQGKNRE
jgi:hypothetical protein